MAKRKPRRKETITAIISIFIIQNKSPDKRLCRYGVNFPAPLIESRSFLPGIHQVEFRLRWFNVEPPVPIPPMNHDTLRAACARRISSASARSFLRFSTNLSLHPVEQNSSPVESVRFRFFGCGMYLPQGIGQNLILSPFVRCLTDMRHHFRAIAEQIPVPLTKRYLAATSTAFLFVHNVLLRLTVSATPRSALRP